MNNETEKTIKAKLSHINDTPSAFWRQELNKANHQIEQLKKENEQWKIAYDFMQDSNAKKAEEIDWLKILLKSISFYFEPFGNTERAIEIRTRIREALEGD